jgi:hypothetical protein
MDIKFINDDEVNEITSNPALKEVVVNNTELKSLLVDYVGEKHDPKDGKVTVEMIVETVASEFPEFLFALAEENFIRGYHQALEDVDQGWNLAHKENEEQH